MKLYEIMPEKKEIIFNWVGYERTLEILKDNHSDDEIDVGDKQKSIMNTLPYILRIMIEKLNGALILSMEFSENKK